MKTQKAYNIFDLYSSKVKRINIPVPAFKFFHKASSEEQIDSKFIGRGDISDKLYAWLWDEKSKGGSYLVTGFRGMGKSSFVGRVLYELTKRDSLLCYVVSLCFFLCLIGIFICLLVGKTYFWQLWVTVLVILSVSMILIQNQSKLANKTRFWKFLWSLICEFRRIPQDELDASNPHGCFRGCRFVWQYRQKIDWKRVCRVLYREYIKNRSYRHIAISVNLGQEVLNEREVLSLISHQLYTRYREYVLSPVANFCSWLVYTTLILTVSYVLLIWPLKKIISENNVNYRVLGIVGVMVTVCVAFYLVGRRFSSSQVSVLHRLHRLNERLDAQLMFGTSYATAFARPIAAAIAKAVAAYEKRRTYDVAKVREIEQELIDILHCIERTKYNCPSFIFVFDELDKVDLNSLRDSVDNTQATEFSHEKNFPGGGTTRRRKQNVLHLLAGMKLFVSTAKAKFIFISGRELYDAYLADLSDREFAVSSIFSGVIYVDSFCVNERKWKDVMSNVEMYICRQLIPQSYINRQFVRHYIVELLKGPAFERFDINLKMYYQYLTEQYESVCPGFMKSPANQYDEAKTAYSDAEIQKVLYRSYIDKTINLLYHFSVYLYHISNGSPKKMMLQFEKYIRKSYHKTQFLLDKNSFDKLTVNPDASIDLPISAKSEYYLSFGYMQQRTIGFIHYISYPVNQILVNANQYSDKLLVSISFLVNHIYKFHNCGFSWRNLEYTPELLEVYKIPGFRGFISSIISYLQQTHLITVTCGLYQFKFRKKIAEEISLASKFSEEIAALFNFTLDESQNVKQHYFDIRDNYLALQERGEKPTPRQKIGLHNILGDLYMFDEEFNNAILEYHAGINTLEEEIIRHRSHIKEPDLKNTLYLIRLMLKLGLANEKRNTYESAFVCYSELVARLLQFRYFDEEQLQLTYRLTKAADWPPYEGLLVAKSHCIPGNSPFEKIHPQIINKESSKNFKEQSFMASGQYLSSVFTHPLTPEKYSVIQRISMFQDIRLIYQALLAKLFVIEKLGVGGITIMNIEMIESEFLYLNMASNVKEKFLTSSDFFRRLGDIMFYKNGLTASVRSSSSDTPCANGMDSFVDGLFYWGYDIRREIQDFCNIKKCYERYNELIELFITAEPDCHKKDNAYEVIEAIISQDATLSDFLRSGKQLKHIKSSKILECNSQRWEMFKNNTPVPCFACKYYSRSMRILMHGMFGNNLMNDRKTKNCSSVFIILQQILGMGTSKSLRQEYVIQLAEILDCKGHVLLSCATGEDDVISPDFMAAFLHDVLQSESTPGKMHFSESSLFALYVNSNAKIRRIEKCMLYYWEASICFGIGNDLMKASASLKKILRVFQNYLKTGYDEQRKCMLRCYMEDIKKAIVKPCLVYLYSHYNNINFAEIQKLKWIFSIHMYESISFSRLSLFPDVEHVMILYYDLIRRCTAIDSTLPTDKANMIRLSYIYRNNAFSFMRHDSTVYERVLALRFKTLMNQDILHHMIHAIGQTTELYYKEGMQEKFVNSFFNYLDPRYKLTSLLGAYSRSFAFALFCEEREKDSHSNEKQSSQYREIAAKLQFVEFLAKDSLYCITRILEVITPHTTTTLFSNSFFGEIYQMLYEWNLFFDGLFMFYKCFDEINYAHSSTKKDECGSASSECEFAAKDCVWHCPQYARRCPRKRNAYETIKLMIQEYDNSDIKEGIRNYWVHQHHSLSDRFFNETMHEIGKAQVSLTLSKHAAVMAIESYKNALEMHHEGRAYKNMISQMYYLDDDLKNDTIQFGAAIERYKINNGYIKRQIGILEGVSQKVPMYDIEQFCSENMINMDLSERFKLQFTFDDYSSGTRTDYDENKKQIQ